MLGFHFIKTRPSDYVLLYKSGQIKREGPGLSFFYYAPSANLVIVPAESRDTPFIYQEATADFQSVDIQGQITWRVADARRLAAMLDFSVDRFGTATGDGSEKLPVRLTNLVQVVLREKLQSTNLRDALTSAAELVSFARGRLKEAEQIQELGLSVLDFAILKISPTPEIAKALEASTRENLLKEADDAIYQRRNFAVDQERKIRENELQTEIAVEEKNREIREQQMNVEIAVEEKQKDLEEAKMAAQKAVEQRRSEIEQLKIDAGIDQERKRKELVAIESENELARARTRAEALRQEFQALNSLSPELLEALIHSRMDSRDFIAKAIRDLANNAQKVGNLNLSPDLLHSLLHAEGPFEQQRQM
ncbi:MAG: band 7 protein [Leptospiraceae bacterium]|nr:band 7 protein [Leptospiraceae bacterium]